MSDRGGTPSLWHQPAQVAGRRSTSRSGVYHTAPLLTPKLPPQTPLRAQFAADHNDGDGGLLPGAVQHVQGVLFV